MVEVFATNINSMKDVRKVQELFDNTFPGFEMNFDLCDIDNVLRVESITDPIDHHSIIEYINRLGFLICVLE